MIGPLPKMCALCFLPSGPRLELVKPFENALLDAFGHRRHRVVLVVERQVVEDVLAFDIHAAHAVGDDDRQLVGEGRVVRQAASEWCSRASGCGRPDAAGLRR